MPSETTEEEKPTMRLSLTLPTIGLVALAIAGCGNQLTQPMTSQTPETVTPTSPKYGEAGGPLVPANNPNAFAKSGTTEAPTPAAREFTVYFATNKATLSPDARSVIEQAAATAKQEPMTRIEVTGHTDTVGASPYNQGLSERRAEAVRQELIAAGVPADQIAASGAGKSQLAVPTAEGVNEPRNRRVAIMEEAEPPAASGTSVPNVGAQTLQKQEKSGYYPAAGCPDVAATTNSGDASTTAAKQQQSGYFPSAGCPVVSPTTTTH
jgi:outer membrane protein OmpA-like peptidoglycan-associated protein